ncbi:MAG: response regulator [Bacteroidota bacterium]|nr:response regulator [Bacteroidota bacterium]MDP4212544.1 response regulator [Bacteroidota bacterium]MDP4250498.1 response regulator [Bacteroidota bacterium]
MKPKNKTILIVDDSPLVLERLREMLSVLSHAPAIISATHYAEAVAIIHHDSPDIVLLDVNLPDKSGVGLLRYIKLNFPRIIVFMISNQYAPYYSKLCESLGAVRFFDKSKEFHLIPEALEPFL